MYLVFWFFLHLCGVNTRKGFRTEKKKLPPHPNYAPTHRCCQLSCTLSWTRHVSGHYCCGLEINVRDDSTATELLHFTLQISNINAAGAGSGNSDGETRRHQPDWGGGGSMSSASAFACDLYCCRTDYCCYRVACPACGNRNTYKVQAQQQQCSSLMTNCKANSSSSKMKKLQKQKQRRPSPGLVAAGRPYLLDVEAFRLSRGWPPTQAQQ